MSNCRSSSKRTCCPWAQIIQACLDDGDVADYEALLGASE